MGLLRVARKPPEIDPGATVKRAVDIMIAGDVGAIAVVEGRRITGVFTERDLMRRVVGQGRDPVTTLVRDVMTSPVVTVMDDTPFQDAANLMRSRAIRHLPILDERGELVAMLALRYVLYDLMDRLAEKADDLQRFIMTDGPGG